jgi:peptidyl-prolyl cis-trans isomerase C
MATSNETTACAVKPAVSAKPKTVSVNGVLIARDAIGRETQNHPAAKPIDAWQAAARALVIRELLLQEAARLGISADPARDADGRHETEEEARMRGLIEREVLIPECDEPTCRRFYQQNQRRFRSQDLYEVSHILLPIAQGEGVAAQVKELAVVLLGTLLDDPERFEALARQHSACPSKQVGGSLGQIGPGQTVREFEKALATMEAGRIHPEPVESRYGLHIVRVDRKIEGRQLPFEIARPLIEGYLTEHVQRTAQRQYVSQLAGRATIEGVTLEASSSPLIQ